MSAWRALMEMYFQGGGWLRLDASPWTASPGTRPSRGLLGWDEVVGGPPRASGQMSFERMKAIADAVLYEGYVLYPYRASSGKNQVRWQFGVLAPPAFCEEHPDEHAWLETQVLVERGTRLRGRVRFLQLQRRHVPERPPWDEGVERTVELDEALPCERRVTFGFPGGRELDGEVLRERHPVRGEVFLGSEAVGELLRVRIRVRNLTRWGTPGANRREVLPAALVGVHTMLHLPDGAFVSLLEPPDSAREAARVAGTSAPTRFWPASRGRWTPSSPRRSSSTTIPYRPGEPGRPPRRHRD